MFFIKMDVSHTTNENNSIFFSASVGSYSFFVFLSFVNIAQFHCSQQMPFFNKISFEKLRFVRMAIFKWQPYERPITYSPKLFCEA